jgi:predicted  nucleic acid-binding Zn-ribbon protein
VEAQCQETLRASEKKSNGEREEMEAKIIQLESSLKCCQGNFDDLKENFGHVEDKALRFEQHNSYISNVLNEKEDDLKAANEKVEQLSIALRNELEKVNKKGENAIFSLKANERKAREQLKQHYAKEISDLKDRSDQMADRFKHERSRMEEQVREKHREVQSISSKMIDLEKYGYSHWPIKNLP